MFGAATGGSIQGLTNVILKRDDVDAKKLKEAYKNAKDNDETNSLPDISFD